MGTRASFTFVKMSSQAASMEVGLLKLATIVSILATIVAVGAISSLGGWAIKIRV